MKDSIILHKINSYLERMRGIYQTIKNMDEQSILELNDSFALTQFITNIHSLSQNVSNEEIAQKLFSIGSRGLNTCRNISAHDYDSLDWAKVKSVCKKLLSDRSKDILRECMEIAKKDESTVKDYKKLSESNVFKKE